MCRRRPSRRRVLSAGGTVLGVGFAGCLEDSPGADDPLLGDPEPFVEVELTIDGTHVDRPIAHLVDGGVVEWTVERGTHDVTAYHPATRGDRRRIPENADPWRSGPLSSGDSFDHVFGAEGVYDYVCTPHEERGAVGSVVVGWPDPDEQPALDPPSDTVPVAANDALERYNDRVRVVLEEAHGYSNN